ncbi:putative esterase/lipase [Sphingobium yanoikuyae]|uniref:Putative esterase/lipase n=1 Tax=Sphingobium yanoikuyae TaxID=13690 RepID=A0A084ESS1_SPHYA|nr:alpha/beta hydrolase [Sphingobium yanoikuyae]KEZ21013.1 putative esterase/lipase [Sphingobium yanoikuyae]
MTMDPQIVSWLATLAAASPEQTPPPAGDIHALRCFTDATMSAMFKQLPEAPDVQMALYAAAGPNGDVALRWYSRTDTQGGAAVIYVHGGGMICGTAEIYDPLVRHYVQLTGIPFLSVDYRRAPEYRSVGLAKDAFFALQWLHRESFVLNVDPRRIAIMGDSGGGGIAAATAIMARDHAIPLSRQILVYPMLDDRNIEADPLLAPTATWTYEANATAWKAVLGANLGQNAVSPYIAPARLFDFTGLAAAYIEVGELDIFRDECLSYAHRLVGAGNSCELHMHPGAPHAYDIIGPSLTVSQQAMADRLRVLHKL